MKKIATSLRAASLATLCGLLAHYVLFYTSSAPLVTDAIAEWIMARTPSLYAVWILETFGAWAKPLAATGGLATLGAILTLAGGAIRPSWRSWGLPVLALFAGLISGGYWSFWIPAFFALGVFAHLPDSPRIDLSRRRFLISSTLNLSVMAAGTLAVAAESYFRERHVAGSAAATVPIAPFSPPEEKFAPGLVRKAVTPAAEFYGMSKNTVDPSPDASIWRLRITINGRVAREFRYAELLSLPRESRYVTLRCISNTLQSDLMGTALWTGIRPSQLVDPASVPEGIAEVAVIGVDGHGDSYPISYFFSDGTLLALGMNGRTLDRTHGFPLRLLVPRYYGFKNVKWISEIAFVRKPYLGTWPKMGYRKEAVIHTASHIDRIRKTRDGYQVGGVSFAGSRRIQNVQIRADQGPWIPATMEPALSSFTWTRWHGLIPLMSLPQGKPTVIEARALDGDGVWQSATEGPMFPSGVDGPTIRRVS